MSSLLAAILAAPGGGSSGWRIAQTKAAARS